MTPRTFLKKFSLLAFSFACLAFISTGCFDDDDDGGSMDVGDDIRALSIEPSPVSLNADEPFSVVFSVEGGDGNYSWSVSDSNLGQVDSQGESVVYSSNPGQRGVNVLMVLDGSSNSGTTTISHE